ncbi:hypothetical protein RKD49_005035 [Streptomyces glaucescens]
MAKNRIRRDMVDSLRIDVPQPCWSGVLRRRYRHGVPTELESRLMPQLEAYGYPVLHALSAPAWLPKRVRYGR